MNIMLSYKQHIARKRHRCNYCGAYIEPGDKYSVSSHVEDGQFYTWKAHEECECVAQAIWEYVDPYDGMGSDEFLEGCQDICSTFVCPDCGQNPEECDQFGYCIDKLYDLFQKYELVQDRRDGQYRYWKLREKRAENGRA